MAARAGAAAARAASTKTAAKRGRGSSLREGFLRREGAGRGPPADLPHRRHHLYQDLHGGHLPDLDPPIHTHGGEGPADTPSARRPSTTTRTKTQQTIRHKPITAGSPAASPPRTTPGPLADHRETTAHCQTRPTHRAGPRRRYSPPSWRRGQRRGRGHPPRTAPARRPPPRRSRGRRRRARAPGRDVAARENLGLTPTPAASPPDRHAAILELSGWLTARGCSATMTRNDAYPRRRLPRRRPRDAVPAGHEGAAQGDAAAGGPAPHPVRRRGGPRAPGSSASSS